MSNFREAGRGQGPDSKALVPVPSSDKMPSRVVQSRLLAQAQEPGQRVTELVLAGEIREFVLVSPWVEGGQIGTRIASPDEITKHPYRVIFFPGPYSEQNQRTFLIAVSVSYQRGEVARKAFDLGSDVNQIERHGLFLIQFPRRNFPDADNFSKWLTAWNGRKSYNLLDQFFPDTSEFGFDNYQASRGFRQGELAFAFSSVYPPNVRPTEHILVSFTANERGPIRIIPVDTNDTRVMADRILAINSTVGSATGRAAQIIAAAERKGGEVGIEILEEIVGKHLQVAELIDDQRRGVENMLAELLERCKSDPRMLDMVWRAAQALIKRVHPDVPGAKGFNPDIVSIITQFHRKISDERIQWSKAREEGI